jgi:branched-chain amino acid transport system permease protein
VVRSAGLLDLGYVAFFALGGYTVALLGASGSRLAPLLPEILRNPWLGLPVAGVVAAGFGLAFGLPSVRTRGEYLAIVTLALGELVPLVIWHLPDLTGGPRGISGIPLARFLPVEPTSPLHAYVLAVALAVLGWLVASRLLASRTGRAWAAVRDDDEAAAAVGVNPVAAKLLAFAVGAGYAGVAGAISAGQGGYVEPAQFDLTLSLMVLAAVVIGSRWGLNGVALAALGVVALDRVLLEAVTNGLRAVGSALDVAPLRAADLQGHNFFVFGLLLYGATLLRVRPFERTSPAGYTLPGATSTGKEANQPDA